MTIENNESISQSEQSNKNNNNTTTDLVVFDFDETIVNCNSDTFINALAPGGTIPDTIWNSFLDDNDWTAYMQQVFGYLHRSGVTEQQYKHCLAQLPFVDGMEALLCNLGKLTKISGQEQLLKKFEVIIISDANTFFINYNLQCNKLDHVIR